MIFSRKTTIKPRETMILATKLVFPVFFFPLDFFFLVYEYGKTTQQHSKPVFPRDNA